MRLHAIVGGRVSALLGLFVAAVLIELSSVSGSQAHVGGVGQVRYGVSAQKGFDTCQAPSIGTM